MSDGTTLDLPALVGSGQGVFPLSISVASVNRANELVSNRSPPVVSPPASVPLLSRFKCRVPLFISLILPALLVAVAFMVVLWQTTSASTSQSVGSLSSRVFDVVQLHLLGEVSLLTRGMAAAAQMGAAAVLVNPSVASLQNYFYYTLSAIEDPLVLSFTSTTGVSVNAVRLRTGERQVGLFDPGVNGTRINGSEPMLLLWKVGPHLEKLELASATPFNPVVRPWYTAVASRNFTTPAFSTVFQLVTQDSVALALGVPVRPLGGPLLGMVAVHYDLDTIHDALRSAHRALRTTGLLVLLAEDGSLISSSADCNSSAIRATIAKLPSLPISGVDNVLHTSLAPFGASFVLQMRVTGRVRPDFFAHGLNWRLFVILPQADYYAGVWSNNRIAAILVAVCTVTFFVVLLFFHRFILVFHLRTLLQGLVQLRMAAESSGSRFEESSDDVVLNTTLAAPKLSVFMEIQALHQAFVEAISSVGRGARERAREIARAAEQTRELMRSKEMFFAMVSHEMRTPLTTCIGMAEILLETTALDPKQRECAHLISCSGSALLSQINDLLDFSKIQSGMLVLDNRPFALRDCIDRTLEIVQMKAETKCLELVPWISSSAPLVMMGD
eukprot:RCo016905